MNAVIQSLIAHSGSDNAQVIKQVEATPGSYAPPVLFALARALLDRGQKNDAIFWFNAARLRGDFDARRCTDPTAGSAISALTTIFIPISFRREQFDDVGALKETTLRVIQWDETIPYNYDPTWINAHGMRVMINAMKGLPVTTPPTVAEARWPALARLNRDEYLASLTRALNDITKKRVEQATFAAKSPKSN